MQHFKVNPRSRTAYYYSKEEGEALKVTVDYRKGGINPFTNEQNGRGYYLIVQPVTIEKRESYSMERSAIFSGLKMLIHPSQRYSQSKLIRLAEEYDNKVPEMVREFERSYSPEKEGKDQREVFKSILEASGTTA